MRRSKRAVRKARGPNKKRLLQMAEMLERDARNPVGIRFDMKEWGVINDEEKPLSCGTAACAMGLAALSGEFRAAGLGYYVENRGISFRWKGQEVEGAEAAARLFNIPFLHAGELFAGKLNETQGAAAEREVARNLRRYLRGALPWQKAEPKVRAKMREHDRLMTEKDKIENKLSKLRNEVSSIEDKLGISFDEYWGYL